MKHERFNLLYKLAWLYRERLDEPKKVVSVLRESLAGVPFFTIPLKKLIADEWPLKERDIGWGAEMGIYLPAARDLVTALERNNDIDASIDMQNRVVLAECSSGGKPYREIEKLWWLVQQRPGQSPLPPVACISILSPEQSSVDFDLDKLIKPRTYASALQGKLNQLMIAARPGFEFDSLELAADMESKGGYVAVTCQTLRNGTTSTLGQVEWYKDQHKGRELRTATFKVAAGTGVIHFGTAWIPGTSPEGVDIHRIPVKATFRKSAPAVGESPVSDKSLAAEAAQAAVKVAQLQARMRQEQAQAVDGTMSLAEAVRAINQQAAKLPETRTLKPLTEDEVLKAIDGLGRDAKVSDEEYQEIKQVAATRRLPKNVVLKQFVRYNDGTSVEHGWWVRLMLVRDFNGPTRGQFYPGTFSLPIRQESLFRRPYREHSGFVGGNWPGKIPSSRR